MHAPVCRVGTRADRRCVGHPHARCRATGHQQGHGFFRRFFNDLRIGAAKPQAAQCGHIRTLLRSQNALDKAHVHQRFHFFQALQRGFPGVGSLLAVALGRDVAEGQPAVVMGRPH